MARGPQGNEVFDTEYHDQWLAKQPERLTGVAWDLIGKFSDHWETGAFVIRIIGGRRFYEYANFNTWRPGRNVLIGYLKPNGDLVRAVNRYVDPDTPIELLRL